MAFDAGNQGFGVAAHRFVGFPPASARAGVQGREWRAARSVAFVVVLALAWLGVLLWVAGIDWRDPLLPERVATLRGGDFGPVFGAGEVRGGRLHVGAAAEDHSALQATRLPQVWAHEVSLLRYRFEGFPRTLELALVFRTAEDPDDVQTVPLPWPGNGETMAFDLSHLGAWRGRIVELGFSQFPTAQLVPPARGFHAFDLVEVELESASWRGRLAALLDDWSLRAPWQLMSVSAIGPSGVGDVAHHAPRLPLVLALALALAALCARFVLGISGRRWRRACAIGVVLLWLGLDLIWLRSLDFRRQVDRDAWGSLPLAQRQQQVSDTEIAAVAERLRDLVADETSPPRILVDTPSPYVSLRLAWLAMPLDVASQASLGQGREFSLLPVGTLLVRYGEGGNLQPSDGVLPLGIQGIAVRTLVESEELAIHRVVERVP